MQFLTPLNLQTPKPSTTKPGSADSRKGFRVWWASGHFVSSCCSAKRPCFLCRLPRASQAGQIQMKRSTRPFLSGLLSNQGEIKYKLLFHKGSIKKKVLKYGTPKPSYLGTSGQTPGFRAGRIYGSGFRGTFGTLNPYTLTPQLKNPKPLKPHDHFSPEKIPIQFRFSRATV